MCKLVFPLEPNFNERQPVDGLLLSSELNLQGLITQRLPL